MAIMTETSK